MNETGPMKEIYSELKVTLSTDDAFDFTIHLDANPPQELAGYYEILYQENRKSEATEMVLYFPAEYLKARWDVETALLTLGIENYFIEEKSIERQQYLEAYKEHYKPFMISKHFAVVPSWLKDTEEHNSFLNKQTEKNIDSIFLDPGIAFGTGLHATTRMMAAYIDDHMKPGMNVLDAGCGSGILSICAKKRGAGLVLAFDTDGNSVRAAIDNAAVNNTKDIQAVKGSWNSESVKAFKPDIIIANITLNIFMDYKNDICNLAGSGTKLIVSGVLTERKDMLYNSYLESWELLSEREDDGWLLAELQRK